MRDAGEAADLEHAQARRGLASLALAIGQAHHAGAAFHRRVGPGRESGEQQQHRSDMACRRAFRALRRSSVGRVIPVKSRRRRPAGQLRARRGANTAPRYRPPVPAARPHKASAASRGTTVRGARRSAGRCSHAPTPRGARRTVAAISCPSRPPPARQEPRDSRSARRRVLRHAGADDMHRGERHDRERRARAASIPRTRAANERRRYDRPQRQRRSGSAARHRAATCPGRLCHT